MEELSMDQILELGQQYYPDMDPQVLLQKFQEVKAQLPADFTNLEIAQVIFASKQDTGEAGQSPEAGRFGGLLGKLRQ